MSPEAIMAACEEDDEDDDDSMKENKIKPKFKVNSFLIWYQGIKNKMIKDKSVDDEDIYDDNVDSMKENKIQPKFKVNSFLI